MSDPIDLAGAGAVSAVTVWLGKYVWDSFVSRKAKLEERAEESEAKALDALKHQLEQVLSVVTRLESDMRVATEAAKANEAVVREVKDRIDGVSSNYGRRMGELEQRMAVLEAVRGGRRR